MYLTIRIKSPSRWKRNYLVDALKKRLKNAKFENEKVSPETELLVTNFLSSDELNSLKKLKYLIIPTSGIELFPLEEIERRRIKIYQNKKLISEGVANYIIDKLTTFYKKPLSDHLKKKKIGLLGFGNIGKRLYEKLSKYGCSFLVVKRKKKKLSKFKEIIFVGTLKDIGTILRKSDILINTLPYTNETKGLLFTRTNHIKKGSLIINLSRSGILDEKEILELVKVGKFGGAIFDVYSSEIKPSQYKDKRIILTPHIAGIYGKTLNNLVDFIENKIYEISHK